MGSDWLNDRIIGAMVGMAVGDALGAPYEFTVPGPGADIRMKAGGPWELGEWTDDTAQAIGIAQVTATGSHDLHAIGQQWLDWYAEGPKDVGISTRAVFSAARADPAKLAKAAADHFAANPRGAAGNGSLMRTAPIALANLGAPEVMAHEAMAVSLLSHGDPLAGEACVLWCAAIQAAVLERRLDGVRDGLDLLPADRAAFWRDRIDEAEGADPHQFRDGNGFCVTALQAAYAAITHTPVPADRPARHVAEALVEAVRIGKDTDTVAAIAGMVLGARWGWSAIPWAWRRHLHGWPGMVEKDLVRLAVMTARRGRAYDIGWPVTDSLMDWGHLQEKTPFCVPLEDEGPDAGGLFLGNLPGLELALDQGVDAVVSLCRVGQREVPDHVEHARYWLVDVADFDANPNLETVLGDAASTVATLRSEGKRVFVHCVGGRSRTATVASIYLANRDDIPASKAMHHIDAVLPDMRLNTRFAAHLMAN